MKLSVNWQIDLQQANAMSGALARFHITEGDDLILCYNQDDDYSFHQQGKLIGVSQSGEIQEIFATERRLWAPVVTDNGDIYLALSDAHSVDESRNRNGGLLKIDRNHKVLWEYTLDGHTASLPVMGKDCVIIFEHSWSKPVGRLRQLGLDGKLRWVREYPGHIWSEPLILKNGREMVLGFRGLNKMFLMDVDGNILREKEEQTAGTIPFSLDKDGCCFACLHKALMPIDEKLESAWEYKPPTPFACEAPVADNDHNLYSKLSGWRLVSLNRQGKERWIVKTAGYVGCQPCIIGNCNILMATSVDKSKRESEFENGTFLEIFTPDGNSALSYELPGSIVHAGLGNEGTIYAVTNCISHLRREGEWLTRALKIFSLSLSGVRRTVSKC